MDRDPPIPPYPDSAANVNTLARDRRLAAGLVGIALLVLIVSILWFSRSPGPPTVPVALHATGETCDEQCNRISPRVTVEWAPPEAGANATGYRLFRDGDPMDATIDERELVFVDEDVTIGESYSYQVIALSGDGDSPRTRAVDATVPRPPDDAAHLEGVYDVELTVRSAKSIGAAFGIENPLPGKRGIDQWSFDSACGEDRGACPSTWTGLEGDIEPDGARWSGTVDGLPARCGSDGRAPAPIEVDLKVVDVEVVGSAWTVTGFRGTAQVSFRCPAFPAASATVEVTGSL